jgi:hypothetical protein
VCQTKYPFWWGYKCEAERHAVEHCLLEDYKLRMMVRTSDAVFRIF